MINQYLRRIACVLIVGLPACGGTDSAPSAAPETSAGFGGETAAGNGGAAGCLTSAKFDYVMKPTYFDEDVPGGAILTQIDGDDRDVFFVAEALYSVPTSGGEPTLRYPSEVSSYWVRERDIVVQDRKQLLTISRMGNEVNELPPLSVAARGGVLVGDELVMQYFDYRRKEGSTGSEDSDFHWIARYFTKNIETGSETVLLEAETDDPVSQRFAIWNEIAYVAVGAPKAARHVHAVPLDGSKENELEIDTAFTELEVLDATSDGLLLYGKPDGGERSLYLMPPAGGVPKEVVDGYLGGRKGFLIHVKRGLNGLAIEASNTVFWIADGSSQLTQIACVADTAFSAYGVSRAGDFFYTNVFNDHDGENGIIRISVPQ